MLLLQYFEDPLRHLAPGGASGRDGEVTVVNLKFDFFLPGSSAQCSETAEDEITVREQH